MGIFSGLKEKWRGRHDRQPSIIMPADADLEKRKAGQSAGIVVDPWELQQNQEFIESLNQHSPATSYTLKTLAETPFTAMFPRYFANMLAQFARPQQGRFGLGYRIGMREEKKAPSRVAQREIDRLMRMASTCGEFINEDVERYTRDSFETFVRKIVRDSSIYDAMCFEVMRDRKGKPASWEARDASTIFRVRPKTPYALMAPNDAAYVQRVNQQNVAWFGAQDMAFAVRCPSSDVKSFGYGRPELVELLAILNQILSAYTLNTNLLKQGGPRGLLAVMGDPIPADKFDAFARGVRVMFSGVRNAGRTPLVNMSGQGADVKWVATDMANLHDMQFQEMIHTNFQLLCSLFGVAPEEVGFYFGNAGQTNSLSQGGTADKVQTGLARGIIPFAYTLEAALNRWIWHPMTDGDFEYRIYGLEGRSEKEQAELDKIRVETSCTVNDIRAEHNQEELDDGDVVLNSVYFEWAQAKAGRAAGPEGGWEGPDNGQDTPPDAPEGGKDGPKEPKRPVVPPTPGKDPTDDWGPDADEMQPVDEARKSLRDDDRRPQRYVIEI